MLPTLSKFSSASDENNRMIVCENKPHIILKRLEKISVDYHKNKQTHFSFTRHF